MYEEKMDRSYYCNYCCSFRVGIFFVYQHYQNRRSESSLKIKVNGHTIAYELRDSPSGNIVYGKEIQEIACAPAR